MPSGDDLRCDDDAGDEGGRVDATASQAATVELLVETWPVLTAAQSRLHDVRERTHRNFDGGDAGHQWDEGLVRRHAVNYAVAASAARSVDLPGPAVDVGAGAGAFTMWLADVLGRPAVLVDRDAGHRELAARAFPQVEVHATLDGLAPAPVVLSMEVIEHVPRAEQSEFVASLASVVQPGGLLVMSTPDESGYWRGWSGYPPHVATVDAPRLGALLRAVLVGWEIQLLRISGPEFDLSRLGRYGVPLANRVWGALDSRVPTITHELAYRMSQMGKRRPPPRPPVPGRYRIGPSEVGAGTGLVALAWRPQSG
jgi:2-polyprenyl-3-methyl-5-hydroxy-6-metoxy-1,4-benzoquinol methylase